MVGGKEKILLPRTLAGASSLCVQQESFPFVWLPERLASPARGARGNRLPRKLWASFECEEAPVFTPLIGEARPDFLKDRQGHADARGDGEDDQSASVGTKQEVRCTENKFCGGLRSSSWTSPHSTGRMRHGEGSTPLSSP